MGLEDVKGIGPSAAAKLVAAGVKTIADLAGLDLRKTTVRGLSSENLTTLRENAQRLLDVRKDPSRLERVPGLGPSAARKLRAVDIVTIHDLAQLDLRAQEVHGLSTEHLQRLRREAIFLVDEP